MSKYLTFVDFPDPDNFLLVLELAKKCDTVDVVLTGRPVDLSYAPSYPSGFYKEFNFAKFAINADNGSPWFSKHDTNEEDTELVFNVNAIRLYKFLQQCSVDMSKVRFFRSDRVDLPLKFKHHMHKQEWKFDLDDESLDIINGLNWKTGNAQPGEVVDDDGNIIRSNYNRDKVVSILQSYISKNGPVKVYNLREADKEYDAFLVAGPFTDVKAALDSEVTTGKIVAMAGAIRTGTVFADNEPRPNLFPDQFNIYADPEAAKSVLEHSNIPIMLIPTEATKTWGQNNNGFVFSAKAIQDSGPSVAKLFTDYYGNSSNESAKFNVFDLVAGRYLLYGSNECTQPIEAIYQDKHERFIIKCPESEQYEYEDKLSNHLLIRSNPDDCIVVGNMYPTDARITDSAVFELFTSKV